MLPVYQSIVDIIESLSHEVTSKHVIKEETTEGNWQKEYNPQQLFQREVDRLKEADLMIAELTTPSWGTMFLIEECLKRKKPLLALYYAHSLENVPLMLRGHPDLDVKMYTEDNIRGILTKFCS